MPINLLTVMKAAMKTGVFVDVRWHHTSISRIMLRHNDDVKMYASVNSSWVNMQSALPNSISSAIILRSSVLRTGTARLSTSPAGAVAKCCDEYVCVSVCLSSAKISPEPHERSLPNFCACCLWPLYSSGVVAIYYAFPVLWMTSFFSSIMDRIAVRISPRRTDFV